jgi:hypothetical protein
MERDPWKDRQRFMRCAHCMYYVEKKPIDAEDRKSYTEIGRCRRHAPQTGIGYPTVYPTDWCGQFKTDENKI